MKALILAPFAPSALQRLGRSVEVEYENWMDTRRLLSGDEFVDRIQKQGRDIVVIEADFLPREVFDRAEKLRFVGVCRADWNHVDVAAATEHGVLVVNTPARNDVAVAELAIGLMLSLARRIPCSHDIVRSRKWVDPMAAYLHLRGTEITGKTIGVVGFGAIGRQVVRRLSAFETSILVYDPYVDSSSVEVSGARLAELDDLLAQADIVTLHCPVTVETQGLISAERISLMKPTAYLINTASWFVLDEPAVARALKEGRIAGAAFDVYDSWPVRHDSPLLDLDNVVLTPHIGGATDETIERHSAMIVDDIERYLKGDRPKNLINPEAWSKRGR